MKEHYEKHLLWVFLSFFLSTKTIKRMNNILHWERQQHYPKKLYYECFSHCCIPNRLNAFKAPSFWKRNYISETCVFSVYERVRHQNNEKHGNLPILENKTILLKACLSSVFFFFNLLTHQKAKTHKKTCFMGKQNNITKKIYFECFHLVTYKKHQNACKLSCMWKHNHITGNVYYECFLSFRKSL